MFPFFLLLRLLTRLLLAGLTAVCRTLIPSSSGDCAPTEVNNGVVRLTRNNATKKTAFFMDKTKVGSYINHMVSCFQKYTA